MLRNLLITIVGLLLSFTSVYASEVTGSINTSDSLSTGLQMSIPCNPAAVSDGTVNATTCAITCNSGFTLSGQSCVALSTGGGGGGGGGGGSSISIFASGSTTTTTTSTPTSNTASGGTDTNSNSGANVNQPAIIPVTTDIVDHWAKDYINVLIKKGIVQNVNKYRPEEPLTRAEFLKIIGNSAGWDTASTMSTSTQFTDVTSDDWYAPYTKYAVANNIIQNASRFRPNDNITRAEVAKILSVSLNITLSTYSGVFIDVPRASSLVLYVEAVRRATIFEGQSTDAGLIFRPGDNITRAEIAKVIVRAFNLQ